MLLSSMACSWWEKKININIKFAKQSQGYCLIGQGFSPQKRIVEMNTLSQANLFEIVCLSKALNATDA